MCEAVALLTFAVSAASTAVGYVGQQQQAEAQNAMYAQNRANAIADFENKQKQATIRQIQEQEAASAARFDTNVEARKAKATAITAAGETGVNGLSIEGILAEYSGRAARANDRVDQQTDWTMAQLQTEKEGFGYGAVDKINSVSRGTSPSFLDAGLRIAGAGVKSYGDAKTNIKNGAKPLW